MVARNAPRVPFKPTPVANLFYRIAGNNDPSQQMACGAYGEAERTPKTHFKDSSHRL
jgi:hypothetical protein